MSVFMLNPIYSDKVDQAIPGVKEKFTEMHCRDSNVIVFFFVIFVCLFVFVKFCTLICLNYNSFTYIQSLRDTLEPLYRGHRRDRSKCPY